MSLKEDFNETKKELEELKEQSLAMELIQDYKKINKRQFIIIIILIFALIGSIGYTIYLLNDIKTIEETTTQEISDFDTINGNVVNNGDVYGQDKTNNKK